MTNIYCLYSSEDGRPRYVGQTTKRVEVRLAQHLWRAKRRPTTPLHRWIRGVHRRGFDVRLHTLQVDVHPADLNYYEGYWLRQFAELLNSARGTPHVLFDSRVAKYLTKALRPGRCR